MDASLNRLTLTFAPAAAERRYRESRADADLRIMRVTYALGIALSSAYFIFDYVALGRFDRCCFSCAWSWSTRSSPLPSA